MSNEGLKFYLPGGGALVVVSFGQSSTQSSTDVRVKKLEETIRNLEQRVAKLEEKPSTQRTNAALVPEKANLRQLKKGMSKEKVEQLLGDPSKIDKFGSWSIWHYRSPTGNRGMVEFNEDSRTKG